MKFNLIKNDKTTYWDEVVIGLFVIISIAIGGLLIAKRPTLLFLNENDTAVLGVLLLILGVMYIPGLIYRLFHNDKLK